MFKHQVVLWYYDGPDVVAFIGDVTVIGLLDENFRHFGVICSAEELLSYVRGTLDLHDLFADSSRDFVEIDMVADPTQTKYVKVPYSYIHPVIPDYEDEDEDEDEDWDPAREFGYPIDRVPDVGSYYMLAHLEPGRQLMLELKEKLEAL